MDMNIASVLKTGRAGGEEWSQQGITTPPFSLFFFLFGTVLVITEGMGLFFASSTREIASKGGHLQAI